MLAAVAVYCGSSHGVRTSYSDLARALGAALAERDITLVYGGGRVGLMGEVADAALERGGAVHGVITRDLLDKEIAHTGLNALDVVTTMHARKERMAALSDAVIALPGGFGTLDELFEALTWTQLGLHRKPCGLLDIDGFFDGLSLWVERAVTDGFVRAEHLENLITEQQPDVLIDRLDRWRPTAAPKWSDGPRSSGAR